MDILDRKLLDVLDGIEGVSYEGTTWRASWTGRDPLAGSSGGGRWAPNGRFDVLYTSLEENGALSEVYYHLSRAPIRSSSEMTISKINIVLDNVLRLTKGSFDEIGITDPLTSKNLKPTQLVGEAAYMLDFAAIIIPSAQYECDNLVIFNDLLTHNSVIEVISTSPINWPAWTENKR